MAIKFLFKKLSLIFVTIIIFTAFLGASPVFAEEDNYKYILEDAKISEIVCQDFEEYDAIDNYISSNYPTDATGNSFGLFSFICPGSNVKLEEENAISDSVSIMFKDFLDARTWMIHTLAEFDSEAYIVKFKVNINQMLPNGNRFSLKLTDINSAEKDNEDSGNPIVYFQNTDGKIGLYNQNNKHLKDIEVEKTYELAIACHAKTKDYYIFLNEEYIPGSKSEFNVEFSQLSAFRFDISGEGVTVTLDDFVVDGCTIKIIEAPTTPPTEKPTQEPTSTPAQTDEVTNAPEPSLGTPQIDIDDSNNQEGQNDYTLLIIAAVSGVVLVGVLIAIIIIIKKKKS